MPTRCRGKVVAGAGTEREDAVADHFAQFEDIVTDLARLTEIVGTPPKRIADKVIDHIDEMCAATIAASPFCLIASGAPGDNLDISPKGDPAGFVKVLDATHLAIPDRPGNRRLDTFHNLLKSPKVALIFLVPGNGATLRVSGEARIVRDLALRQSMAIDGKVPALALVVHVEEAMMHCPKCAIRSGIWDPATWPGADAVPDISEAMIRHAKIEATVEEHMAFVEKEGLLRLY